MVAAVSFISPGASSCAASGFALTEARTGGVDWAVGWFPAPVYLPHGRARDAILHAETISIGTHDKTFQEFARCMRYYTSAVMTRAIENVAETVVQDAFNVDVSSWWPNTMGDVLCFNAHSVPFPVPLFHASACFADYLRQFAIGGHNFVVAFGELKKLIFALVDALPQVLVGSFSAAIHLHRAGGLAIKDCVVPFLVGNGQCEQHGVAYLLDGGFPCALLTTGVLDLYTSHGQVAATRARFAMREIAEFTVNVLTRCAISARPGAAVPVGDAFLHIAAYHIKKPLHFVGNNVAHSVWHQLRVFARLQEMNFVHTAYPVAVLQKCPSGNEWKNEFAMVFQRLVGYRTGRPDRTQFAAFTIALINVVRKLHRAGVVHIDLFPNNVMWKFEPTGDCHVMLVDFDASLFIGDRVPLHARAVVERNGHMHSYDARLFDAGACALEVFDWWHVAVLSEYSSPFWNGDIVAFQNWLDGDGKRCGLRERAASLVRRFDSLCVCLSVLSTSKYSVTF